MKLSLVSSVFALGVISSTVFAQEAAVCFNETEAMYEAHPDLEQAEQEYLEIPTGAMMANCMNRETGEIMGCTGINLGQSDKGDM